MGHKSIYTRSYSFKPLDEGDEEDDRCVLEPTDEQKAEVRDEMDEKIKTAVENEKSDIAGELEDMEEFDENAIRGRLEGASEEAADDFADDVSC